MCALPDSLKDLESQIQQGNVRRPLNELYWSRSYEGHEVATLEKLEPDASKVIGRHLTSTERNVLLEYKARQMASESRIMLLGKDTGCIAGMLIGHFTPRVRTMRSKGRHISWYLNLAWRGFVGGFIGDQAAALYTHHKSMNPPLPARIANDPRMTQFKASLEARREEFGGNLPILVRSWRKANTNAEPQLQWFRDVFPQEDPQNRPPIIEHPELHWYRAWPSESEGEEPEDDECAENMRSQLSPLEERRKAQMMLKETRSFQGLFNIRDLGLKPCIYV